MVVRTHGWRSSWGREVRDVFERKPPQPRGPTAISVLTSSANKQITRLEIVYKYARNYHGSFPCYELLWWLEFRILYNNIVNILRMISIALSIYDYSN